MDYMAISQYCLKLDLFYDKDNNIIIHIRERHKINNLTFINNLQLRLCHRVI